MLTKINSAVPFGFDSIGVIVEVNISSRGMPYFDIVGLANKSVNESKHRVKTALQNSDIAFPEKRIVVNLAPADLPKEGSYYDFPIACGIIFSSLGISPDGKSLYFGELSLAGELRSTRGIISLCLYAKENGFNNIFLPYESRGESTFIPGLNVFLIRNIKEFYQHITGKMKLSPYVSKGLPSEDSIVTCPDLDFSNIIGHEKAKRALMISIAGGHNLIMEGSPGSGKTMLARSVQSILPKLLGKELVEVCKINSLDTRHSFGFNGNIYISPFRSPHHTISYVGMLGGGSTPRPGEVTLSHRGILFLDEFTEFPRNVIEALRQPLEDGYIRILRNGYDVKFPSKFILIAAYNPCPCGYYGSKRVKCKCSPKQIQNYRKKLSGPILDRIDISLEVFPVEESFDNTKLYTMTHNVESSKDIRERVLAVRAIQCKRFELEGISTNSEMTNFCVQKYCILDSETASFLNKACSKFGLSTRAYFKILKVARTITDLEGDSFIRLNHVAESLSYRTKNVSL